MKKLVYGLFSSIRVPMERKVCDTTDSMGRNGMMRLLHEHINVVLGPL